MKPFLYLLFCSILISIKASALVRYVDSTAIGTGNGTTWANAYNSFGNAIQDANSNLSIDTILVAKGTYSPQYPIDGISTDPRQRAFTFTRGNLKLLAGYPSGGGSIRNWNANKVRLSGDIGILNNNSDNSYHVVVTAATTSNSVILDGFIISGGNANGGSTVTVNGLSVFSNSGGGLFNSGSAIEIFNTTMSGNEAASHGGGWYNYSGNAYVANLVLTGNKAARGGGWYNQAGSTNVNSTTVAGNNATLEGGGCFINSGSLFFANTVVYGNTAPVNGGVTSPYTANYSLVQDVLPTGTLNLSGMLIDPLFTNPIPASWAPTVAGDYSLMGGSLLRESGSLGSPLTTDITGSPRTVNGRTDLGAYEYQGAPQADTLYVDSTAAAGGDGLSWTHAINSFANAVWIANRNLAITAIFVAKGTYYPIYPPDYISTAPRRKTFCLFRNNLAVMGGYPSGGGSRDWTANPVVLSGDIGLLNNNVDNVYHVLITNGLLNNTVVIDGFNITKGNADGTGSIATLNGYIIADSTGGGWINKGGSVIMSHLNISGNAAKNGGGWTNDGGNPNVSYAAINGNTATGLGGGYYDMAGSPLVTHATISNNTANSGGGLYSVDGTILNDVMINANTAISGGGWYNLGNSLLTNTTLSGNLASGNGGGWYNNNGNPTLTNVVITGNKAASGGGWYQAGGAPGIFGATVAANNATVAGGGCYINSGSIFVYNTILYGNGAPASAGTFGMGTPVYSLIQGMGASGVGNLDGNIVNPLFISPVAASLAPTTTGDYGLQSTSSVINAGTNGFVYTGNTTDRLGNPRIINGTVDMGAYESNSALLLQLSSFKAKEELCVAKLEWRVADAKEVLYFEILRSTDGRVFGSAGEVMADADVMEYSSKVLQVETKAYYRLKIAGIDGSIQYTGVLPVVVSCGVHDIEVFPNPLQDVITITGLQAGQQLVITNATGSIVFSTITGSTIKTVDLSTYSNGIYYLLVKDSSGQYIKTEKLIKAN